MQNDNDHKIFMDLKDQISGLEHQVEELKILNEKETKNHDGLS